MARTVKDANLGTAEARRRLDVQGKPHYRVLEEGLHLGYRRLAGGAGKWVARFYAGRNKDGHGEYVTETFAIADDLSDANGVSVLSFSQAQARARELRDTRDLAAAGKRGPITVGDAMTAYLEHLENEGKSIVDTKSRINAFIVPALGAVRVDELTSEQINKWRTNVVKQPARVRSAKGQRRHKAVDDDEAKRRRKVSSNRTLVILRAGLSLAFRAGLVPSDNAWRTVRPFKRVNAARLRYLTVDEARRFANACAPDFKTLARAALLTGCRYGELCRLHVADFNPDVGTVHVRKSKSAKARHVVLSAEGVAFFAGLCAGRAGNEVMLRKADGSTWRVGHQTVPMIEAVARARISPSISFHGLRHTFCSLSVMNGVPLMVIAKALGHSTTRMVEQHYGHLAPSFVADEIRKGAPRFGFEVDSNVVGI